MVYFFLSIDLASRLNSSLNVRPTISWVLSIFLRSVTAARSSLDLLAVLTPCCGFEVVWRFGTPYVARLVIIRGRRVFIFIPLMTLRGTWNSISSESISSTGNTRFLSRLLRRTSTVGEEPSLASRAFLVSFFFRDPFFWQPSRAPQGLHLLRRRIRTEPWSASVAEDDHWPPSLWVFLGRLQRCRRPLSIFLLPNLHDFFPCLSWFLCTFIVLW